MHFLGREEGVEWGKFRKENNTKRLKKTKQLTHELLWLNGF